MKKFQPVIKWTGSKRSQAEEILSRFPREIDTYYEPFVGGGSILRSLLESDIKVNKIVVSDINFDLINLWNCIKQEPDMLIRMYTKLYNRMLRFDTVQCKSKFYTLIRNIFNNISIEQPNKRAFIFLWLTRTCFNGMPRYNSKGEFNTSYHVNRNGIEPSKLEKIINEWSSLIQNVEFVCRDFKGIQPTENDFVYMDPPYDTNGPVYFNNFSKDELLNFINNLNCKWCLSYNGDSKLPYNSIDIIAGKSSFRKFSTDDKHCIIKEKLYFNE